MFGFIAGIPRRVRHLLSRFKRYFSRRQYENFCRTTLGLIVAGEGDHDVKSINELLIDRKGQSSLNRFMTEPKWSIAKVVGENKALLLSEAGRLNKSAEYKVIDDTVCRKYSLRTEMVCYTHSSTLGTVLSHYYVTSLYVNNGLALPDGLKLYGNEKKCKEKGIKFKTKVQLACALMDEHIPRAKHTIWLWDSWFTCHDTAARCGAHRYNWIGEIKCNRIPFYEGMKYRLNELLDRMRSEGRFMDVMVDGEVYQACKVDDVFIPKMGYVSIVMHVKAGTKHVHLLCTDLTDCSLEEIVHHALQRHKIRYMTFIRRLNLRPRRVWVQGERSGAYTRAPSLPGLYSPRCAKEEASQVLHREAPPVHRGYCGVGEEEEHAPLHT